MIQENRPQLKSTLGHLNDVSGQLQPVLDDLRKTSARPIKRSITSMH